MSNEGGGPSISVKKKQLLRYVVTANKGWYPLFFSGKQLLQIVVTAKGWWYKIVGFKKTLTTDDVL